MFVDIDFIEGSRKGLWGLRAKVGIADSFSALGYFNKSIPNVLVQQFLRSRIQYA